MTSYIFNLCTVSFAPLVVVFHGCFGEEVCSRGSRGLSFGFDAIFGCIQGLLLASSSGFTDISATGDISQA